MDAYGYDGIALAIGDRIEIHPATDLWMRGAKYGVIVGIVPTPDDRIRVEMDAFPGLGFCGSADTFRKIPA